MRYIIVEQSIPGTFYSVVYAFFQSVSDDSVDLGTRHTSVLDNLGQAPVRPVKKASVSVPWWQDDDYSEEGPGECWSPKGAWLKSPAKSLA